MFNNPQFLLMNKFVAVLFWLGVIMAHTVGLPKPLGPLLYLAGPLILLAHIVEVGFFLVKYKDASKNVFLDAIQILVFGIFHFKPIIERSRL